MEQTKNCAKDTPNPLAGKSHPWYITLGTSFSTLEEIREILPHNREQFAEKYGERLLDRAESFESLVDNFVSDFRQSSSRDLIQALSKLVC